MVGGTVRPPGAPPLETAEVRSGGSMTHLVGVARAPSGPAFTVVLVCHVAAVLLALVAVLAGAVAAARVLVGEGRPAPWVRSYFAPSPNWAGRILYLVPVFGVVLVAMSGGAYGFGAGWVDWGIGLWVAAAALAEGVLWPAERRVQLSLVGTGDGRVPEAARRACRTMCVAAAPVVGLMVAAMVVMVAKP